uniref:Uncharacterized protein n=1 Tax=Romanomermis culicivorax TaxID=13658 RepID=A0A915JRS3_ROMCU
MLRIQVTGPGLEFWDGHCCSRSRQCRAVQSVVEQLSPSVREPLHVLLFTEEFKFIVQSITEVTNKSKDLVKLIGEMFLQLLMNLIFGVASTLLFLKTIHTRPASQPQCLVVDLTHDFSPESTQYWDAMEKFKMSTVFNGTVKPAGYHYEAYKFHTAEHGGTHLDAPSHFSENGSSVDKVSNQQRQIVNFEVRAHKKVCM